MKIKEVSEKFQLPIPTLRYYEKIGLLDPVARVNGIREYQEADLERIEFILCMKESSLSLEDLKKYFDYYRQGTQTLPDRLALLEAHEKTTKEKMAKLQASLDYLHFKINLTKENIQKETSKATAKETTTV